MVLSIDECISRFYIWAEDTTLQDRFPPFRRKFCIVIGWFGQTLSGKPITALASTCVLLCLVNIRTITMRLPSSTVCTWKTADSPRPFEHRKTKNLPRCYSNILPLLNIFVRNYHVILMIFLCCDKMQEENIATMISDDDTESSEVLVPRRQNLIRRFLSVITLEPFVFLQCLGYGLYAVIYQVNICFLNWNHDEKFWFMVFFSCMKI